MALVRVYCGLASADDAVRSASAAPLTVAVVDDAGRLLGVHEISDDPSGYAQLGTLLVERTTGFSDAAVAADSDDHVVTSLLTAAGRPLVVVDDDAADDYAERFSDDDSPEEISAPAAARRAVGLARALQAGAIAAVTLPAPRELVSYKPVLAAHVAMLVGRNGAAVALREVLRELYPAALRAFPDPAHPTALAVLDAMPEPGRLTGPAPAAREIAIELVRAGSGTESELTAAITALQVAVSESPRRGGVNKSLSPAAAEAVRKAISAVRACDSACSALVGTLAARATPPAAGGSTMGRRSARRGTDTPALPSVPSPATGDAARFGRRNRPEPVSTGSGPAMPQALTTMPTAPDPLMAPPVAPAAANGLPGRATGPLNRPVSVPPPPPGMTPITPGTRPAPATRNPATPTSVPPVPGGSPADAGEPFRPTLTNAELNRARSERRTVIPQRPTTSPRSPAPANGATDFSLPMPTPRTPQETPEPGSRANWPLLNSDKDEAVRPDLPTRSAAPPLPSRPSAPPLPTRSSSAPPLPTRSSTTSRQSPAASVSPAADSRIKPPWQDMPQEPSPLDLGSKESTRRLTPPPSRANGGRARLPGLDLGGPSAARREDDRAPRITALDRSSAPPVPSDSNDGDLLIFAAARSAWFTGGTPDSTDVNWSNPNDDAWRAAQKAATPAVAAETNAGLPKRVPQANLVPGSSRTEERPVRIVRDAASIAAHTTGYFRGWRRGQEIGGFAMGGRPGREAAGGWDFSRDGQPADEFRSSNGASHNGR
ncbi:MAG TPA: transposase [Actinoplanes sp.]|nr:transposase [Actinoplanes sp.]